jgi:hypothetical protein
MAKTSKWHYEQVAKIIGEEWAKGEKESIMTRLTDRFVSLFKNDNKRFDAYKFVDSIAEYLRK